MMNRKLKTFRYQESEEQYVYQNDFDILNAPVDADFSRWAMLSDEDTFRCYCFKMGTNDTLYQFAFNGTAYEFGYESIPELKIVNAPQDANTNKLCMLHDEDTYRLYMPSYSDSRVLYQFEFDGDNYAYLGTEGIMRVSGFEDTASDTCGMLFLGENYHYYTLNADSLTLNQAIYNDSTSTYERAENADIDSIPAGTDTNTMALAGGQDEYWLYFLDQAPPINLTSGFGSTINGGFGS